MAVWCGVVCVQENCQHCGPTAASRQIQLIADPTRGDVDVVPKAIGQFVELGLKPLDCFSGKLALAMYWSVRSSRFKSVDVNVPGQAVIGLGFRVGC